MYATISGNTVKINDSIEKVLETEYCDCDVRHFEPELYCALVIVRARALFRCTVLVVRVVGALGASLKNNL